MILRGAHVRGSVRRQRHEKLVGREALLARLDALLVDNGADRWVVVTGGPGMGKSAILSAWLTRREAAGTVVPHHFIRRGAYRFPAGSCTHHGDAGYAAVTVSEPAQRPSRAPEVVQGGMRSALVLVVLIGSVGCGRDATRALEVFADRACACADKKDTSCARGVVNDLVTFASQNTRAHGDESKTKASGERMGVCLIRAGIDPKDLVSQLQQLER